MAKSKKEIAYLHGKLDQFIEDQKLKPAKCMSDQAELWMRYILYKLEIKGYRDYDQEGNLRMDVPATSVDGEEFDEEEFRSRVVVRALNIMKELRGSVYIGSRSPRSVAAAIIYISCVMVGVNITQYDVAQASDTSENTIAKIYREIKHELKL